MREIDWNSLEPGNLPAGLQQWVSDLNHLYRDEPALWAGDYSEPGFFGWIAKITSTVWRALCGKHLSPTGVCWWC